MHILVQPGSMPGMAPWPVCQTQEPAQLFRNWGLTTAARTNDTGPSPVGKACCTSDSEHQMGRSPSRPAPKFHRTTGVIAWHERFHATRPRIRGPQPRCRSTSCDPGAVPLPRALHGLGNDATPHKRATSGRKTRAYHWFIVEHRGNGGTAAGAMAYRSGRMRGTPFPIRALKKTHLAATWQLIPSCPASSPPAVAEEPRAAWRAHGCGVSSRSSLGRCSTARV